MYYLIQNSFIAGTFITLSVYHIIIYLGRKNELSNLSYSLHNLAFSINILLTILCKYLFIINYKTYIIFLGLNINIIAVAFAFFIFTIFDLKRILKSVVILNFFVIIGSIFFTVLYAKTDKLIFGSLPILLCTVYAVFFIVYGGFIIIKTKQHKKNKFNKMMFIGIIIMSLSFIFFGLLKSIFIYLSLGDFSYIPLFAIIFFFEYALISQYNALCNSLETEVKKQTDIIKTLEGKKRNFFINFAHEIRTPVTLISNTIESIYKNIKNADKNFDIKTLMQNIDISRNNAARIKRDIINFLSAEKIERGDPIYIHDKIVNFSKILVQKTAIFQDGMKSKNIDLSEKIDGDIFIKIDPLALERIINNILDNAYKYTNEHGSINISLTGNRNKIEFIVTDNGIGIDQKDIKNIYKPFTQLTRQKNQFQGMGLGLSIVKNILDDLTAKIKVRSELNKGTSFKIIFNRYKPSEKERLIQYPDYSFEEIVPVCISRISIAETEVFDKDKETVFLVEDNPDMIAFLLNGFKDKYNFYFSRNGKEALEKLRVIAKPDIIISDIMMDAMDGYEFYDIIKNNIYFKNLPFLFLSAKSSFEDKMKGLSRGAVDYIIKPFVLEELLAKIESLLKLNRQKELDIIESIFQASKKQLEEIRKVSINYGMFKDKYNLTNNEIEICRLIKEKLSNKEIGLKLNKAESTVKNNIQVIFEKLGIDKREKLIDILLNFLISTF